MCDGTTVYSRTNCPFRLEPATPRIRNWEGDRRSYERAIPRHPSGFRPRIGVRGRLFAGMTAREICGIPWHYRGCVPSSRIGVQDMLSYQPFMPACPRSPRNCNSRPSPSPHNGSGVGFSQHTNGRIRRRESILVPTAVAKLISRGPNLCAAALPVAQTAKR